MTDHAAAWEHAAQMMKTEAERRGGVALLPAFAAATLVRCVATAYAIQAEGMRPIGTAARPTYQDELRRLGVPEDLVEQIVARMINDAEATRLAPNDELPSQVAPPVDLKVNHDLVARACGVYIEAAAKASKRSHLQGTAAVVALVLEEAVRVADRIDQLGYVAAELRHLAGGRPDASPGDSA